MPYIQPKLREFYDMIVNGVKLKLMIDKLDLNEEKKILSHHLKTVPDLMAQDGEFNYFITKLLITLGWVDKENGYYDLIESDTATMLEDFLMNVVKEVYTPAKYFNYNRAEGMLLCCMKEFRRRYGNEAKCVEIFLNSLIDILYNFTIGPYEDGKIKENGDVTK